MEKYLFVSYRYRNGPEWTTNVRRIKKLLKVEYDCISEKPFEPLFAVSHVGKADGSRVVVAGAGTTTNAILFDYAKRESQPVPFTDVPAWTLNYKSWRHLRVFFATDKIVFFEEGSPEKVFEIKGFLSELDLKSIGSVINHSRGACVFEDRLYFQDDESSLRSVDLLQVRAGAEASAVEKKLVLEDVVDFAFDPYGNMFYIDSSDCLKKVRPKGDLSTKTFRFDRSGGALVSTGLHCCSFRLVLACFQATESDYQIRLFSLDNRLKKQHECSYPVDEKEEFAMYFTSFKVKKASFLVVGRNSNWIDLFVFKGFKLHPVRLRLGQGDQKIESDIDGIVWCEVTNQLLFTTAHFHSIRLTYS